MTKPERKKDPALLAFVRTLPCLACLKTPSDAHHVTSRGAGGDDTPENVMPLCSEHHQLWHLKGWPHMVKTFGAIRYWLEAAGRSDKLPGV